MDDYHGFKTQAGQREALTSHRHGIAGGQNWESAGVDNAKVLDAVHAAAGVDDGRSIVSGAHAVGASAVVGETHVVADPGLNLVAGLDLGAGVPGGLDDGTVQHDFADAEEGCHGHLDVALVAQPVGVDDGRVKRVGTADRHVAARRRLVQRRAHEQIIVVGPQVVRHRRAFQAEEVVVGPVRRETVLQGLRGVTENAFANRLGCNLIACRRREEDSSSASVSGNSRRALVYRRERGSGT